MDLILLKVKPAFDLCPFLKMQTNLPGTDFTKKGVVII
jgi:hypothetical protein